MNNIDWGRVAMWGSVTGLLVFIIGGIFLNDRRGDQHQFVDRCFEQKGEVIAVVKLADQGRLCVVDNEVTFLEVNDAPR